MGASKMARDSRRTSIATLAREGGPATEPDHRDEFEVVGRAGPVEFSSVPYVPAEAREDLLVVKEGSLFVCTRPDGDIWPGRVTGEGLYARDTRFLSELRLTLGGASPVLLSSSADARYAATV